MLRGRCAGDVLIIEVNRPPVQGSCDVTGSPRIIPDGVIGKTPPEGYGMRSCLEHNEGGDKQGINSDRCRRTMVEEIIYVELDVDCRRNTVTPTKYAGNLRTLLYEIMSRF